ncbi:MAG: lipocalin-like domain-containing protein [Dehalococcoidales bacterium]|nr:lipocalin-like domain-containing protein [Dehalococcoidales bacterium]
MSRDRFIGAWKLITAEFRSTDGKVNYLWGKNAAGLIIYSAGGNVSAQIMNPDRPKFASRDNLKGTPEEAKAAFDGYQAYFGTFEVDEKEKLVIHHITGNLFPNAIGINLKRFYEFSENDRLTLSTPPMSMGGERVTGVLVWERINPSSGYHSF